MGALNMRGNFKFSAFHFDSILLAVNTYGKQLSKVRLLKELWFLEGNKIKQPLFAS